MKTLIDFSPIKSGGGAQLALNFLTVLNEFKSGFGEVAILVSDRFPFLDRLSAHLEVVMAPGDPAGRLKFEWLALRTEIRRRGVTHVYTFFGPGLPKMSGVTQMVGVAYPILCYDDSPYWSHLPFGRRTITRLKNYARKRRLRGVDVLVFETDIMRSRSIAAIGLDPSKCYVLAPTPTSFLKSSPLRPRPDGETRFLFLSGADPHKNLWRLPGIFPKLLAEKHAARFWLSITEEAFLKVCRDQGARVDRRLVREFVRFLGPVAADQIQTLYDQIDVVANISDLESFSNNYLEGWLSGRPILASDRDFARSICGGSAIFVEPHSETSLFDGVALICRETAIAAQLAAVGQERLALLPSMEQRLRRLANLIVTN